MHGNGVRKRLNQEAEARARGEGVPGNRENRPDIVKVKTESRNVFYKNLHKKQKEEV